MPAKSFCKPVFSSIQPVMLYNKREISYIMPAKPSNMPAKAFNKLLFHSTCQVKASASYVKAFANNVKAFT